MKRNVNFKRILSRTNRGIVLGIVLGILLVSFVFWDGVRFNSQKKIIKADIVNCITEMAELNALVDSSPVGTSISDEDRTEIRAGLEEILGEYYADPSLCERITVYDGYDSGEFSDVLDLWFGRTAAFGFYEVKVDGESEDFKVNFERQGYKYAFVQINDLPVEFKITSAVRSTEPFLGAGPSYLIDDIFFGDFSLSGKEQNLKLYVSGNLYMTLEDGEWKILMSDFYTKTQKEIG